MVVNGGNQGWSPKGLPQRVLELLIGLLILSLLVQMFLAVVAPFIPYAVIGLLAFGIGYGIYYFFIKS